jgi:RNA polymerase sigma factor (sigma-70 family)
MAGMDRQDLEAFVRHGSQEAFARLAGRYARMVYAACLSQLGSPEDAEDAAQAVFLALARKAGSIRPERVGSWLYGVAMRASRFMARSAARRARHEGEAGRMMASGASSGGSVSAGVPAETRRQLMAELERLPAALRETVVRHYLGGQTRAQLAEELGLPSGTVNSRLNAGIERLRARLGRRGVTLSAAALGPALAAAASAEAPASLLASLPALASGGTAALAAGAEVAAIADGVLRIMFWEKLRMAAVAVGAAGLLAGAAPLALSTLPGERPPRLAPAPPAAAPVQPVAAAPRTVTGRVVRDRDVKAFEAVVVKELTGAVRVGDRAACKAKGWSSTVKRVDSDRVLLEPRELAEAGDAVEFAPADLK